MMELLDNPYVPNEWAHTTNPAWVIAEGSGFLWMSAPMAFGAFHLLGVNGPDHVMAFSPVHGWAYRSEAPLLAALASWNPETENEPVGWHKRQGDPRLAPHGDRRPEYNFPRCIHGSYVVRGMCDVTPYCKEMPGAGQVSLPSTERITSSVTDGTVSAVFVGGKSDSSTTTAKESGDMIAEYRIDEALNLLKRTGVAVGEAHHLEWTIDQMVRCLTGCPEIQKTSRDGETYTTLGESLEYQDFVKEMKDVEDGPDTYTWSTGIIP